MFKPIPNFSQYQVDETGVVINSRGRALSPYMASQYRAICLGRDDGKRKATLIHRLVWEAHRGPIPKGHWVNHKNGEKTDNRLENLECDTPSYNHLHASNVLKRRYASGEECAAGRFSEEAILAIKTLRKLKWSQHKIAKVFGCSQPAIFHVLQKKTKSPIL